MSSSPRLTMNFSEVSISDVETYLTDPRFAVEQKVDGTRALVVITTGDDGIPFFRFLGRRGTALTHAAAMLHFAKIESALAGCFTRPGETVLDGEIMFDQGRFVIFDLPHMEIAGHHWTSTDRPYSHRRETLEVLRSCLGDSEVIVIAPSATTEADKRASLAAVEQSHGEGVMVKDLDAAYHPGKRVKHSVKVKFVKTADVVVTATSRGRNDAGRETGSFEIAVWSEGVLEVVGATSAIGKAAVEVGDVIEVAYLYMGAGGRLVQPRMLRVRDDKASEDCTPEQFPLYSKALV